MRNNMATPIINTNLGKVVTATGAIADDLSTLRPLLRNMIFNAFPTDKIENAPIATFPDGADNVPVKSATFAIVPQQDLHGYSNPWPAGGGKNKLPMVLADIKAANTSGTWSGNAYALNGITYTIQTNAVGAVTGINVNGTASATSSLYVAPNQVINLPADMILNGCPTGGLGSTYFLYFYDDTDSVIRFIDTGSGANVTAATINGHTCRIVISVTNGVTINNQVFYPMLRLATEADATFAPYSNICPITGFTGAEITDNGKNWAKLSENNKGSNQKSTVTYTDDGATVTATGAYGRMGWLIPVKEGKTYTVSFDCVSSDDSLGHLNRIYLCRQDGYWDSTGDAFIAMATATTTETNYHRTFTARTPVLFIGVYATSSASDGSVTLSNLQVELGSTATAYAPFVGTTHDITWQDEAGTVYGGTLEYLGGDAWRLTKKKSRIDLGAKTWQWVSSVSQFMLTTGMGDIEKAPSNDIPLNAICEAYPVVAYNYNADMTLFAPANNGNLRIRDSRFEGSAEGAQALKASLNGVYFVYELATPVTYDLTGEELATVLGNNNVFSSTGDVTELVYRADTALYIEKKLAE